MGSLVRGAAHPSPPSVVLSIGGVGPRVSNVPPSGSRQSSGTHFVAPPRARPGPISVGAARMRCASAWPALP
eukprot:2913704-Alexandrium_andersonii.AAC.1